MSAAVGQKTWLGIGKQPNFSTKVAPVIFHGIDTFSPVPKYGFIERPEARMVADRVLAANGPYSFSGALKVAPDPGAVEQPIAFAMGTQSAPTPAVIYATASTGAVAATGSATVPVTTGTGSPNLIIGSVVVFDATGPNVETVTLTAVTANSITAVFTKTHPTAAVINLLGTLSMGSTYSFGSITELPYFGFQHYRGGTDTYDFVGNAIDTMKVSLDSAGKLAGFEFGIVGNAVAPIVQNAPATPSFVTTQPFTSELGSATYTGGAGAQIMGVGGVVPLMSYALTLNNQLDKAYRTIGSQYPISFPLGYRKVSATCKMGFDTDQAFLDFLAQGTIALSIKLLSSTIIETINGIAVPYSITLTMPSCRILQDPVSQKATGPLDQTLTLEAYASSIGANNSLIVSVVNTATAVY